MSVASQSAVRIEEKARRWALLWVAAGAGLWGTDTVLRRPLTAALDSVQLVLLEHLALAAVLLPVVWRSREQWRRLSLRGWTAVIGIAWGGSALGTICFTEAIRLGNPNSAVLLQKLQPVFAALLAHALLTEPLGRRFWAFLVLALGGAWLISFGASVPLNAVTDLRAASALLALSAATLWGASTVLGRFALDHVSFVTLTALRIVVATPLLLLLALARSPVPALSAPQAGGVALLALVPGLIALLVYYRGLRHARASRAAVAELSFPAVAVLLNWLVLGAGISPAQLAGFALVWGVIWAMRT